MAIDPALSIVFKLPFQEQESFFKNKLNIPTARWDDLWKGQHARGFMIAGAMKADLLADFRTAVDKAISDGVTLRDFRKDFDRIVAKHGWSYNGSRNWRSEVIYSTNIRTSYAAGRWAQLTDPDMLKFYGYLVYRHGDSIHPRPLHRSWDGTTLPANDPWWDSHYVPNGWGCKCKVFAAGKDEWQAARKNGKGEAPPSPIDPKTGEPVGIDKGWGYNVGKAAFGKSWIQETGKFIELGPWRRAEYPFLPKKLTGERPPVELGERIRKGDVQALRTAVPEGIYRDKMGDSVSVTTAIADHIAGDEQRWDGREQYLPLIPDILENPQEIWVGFMQFVDSGRVYLRRRYVKAYDVGKGRVAGIVADTIKGQTIAFDVIRSENPSGGRLRSGRLIYPEPEER
ncbi:PBECR2 nuclease fold domain-containing protein [Syntrophus aciditrophicus]|nr:PBECR2 nuclease fold domain-containing protein [Syntrophus aciditrophicus]